METARCPLRAVPPAEAPRTRTQALVICVRRKRDFPSLRGKFPGDSVCCVHARGSWTESPPFPCSRLDPSSRSLSLLPPPSVTVAYTPLPPVATSQLLLVLPAAHRQRPTSPGDLAAAVRSPQSTSRRKLRCYSQTRVITSVPCVESPRPSLVLGSKSKLLNVDFEALLCHLKAHCLLPQPRSGQDEGAASKAPAALLSLSLHTSDS